MFESTIGWFWDASVFTWVSILAFLVGLFGLMVGAFVRVGGAVARVFGLDSGVLPVSPIVYLLVMGVVFGGGVVGLYLSVRGDEAFF